MPPRKATPRRKMGRPTKLSPELQDRICSAIRAGCFVETAVAMVGIHKDTLYTWLKRAQSQKRGMFREFADAVEKAMGEFEAAAVARIAKAGQDPKQWYATAWLLERRFPRRWARPEIQIEHYGSDEDQAPRVLRTPLAGPGGSPGLPAAAEDNDAQ